MKSQEQRTENHLKAEKLAREQAEAKKQVQGGDPAQAHDPGRDDRARQDPGRDASSDPASRERGGGKQH